MNFEQGTIYIIKTKWGEVCEGRFVARINDTNIFEQIFWNIGLSAHFISDEDCEWAQAICRWNANLTYSEYMQHVSNLNSTEKIHA